MQSVNASIKVAVETLIQAAFGVGYTAALPAGFHAWTEHRGARPRRGGPWDCCSALKAEGNGRS